ncbi:hypothetical protein [Streptococcus salivarius]|uniref:hypothetical protein n=1 Tax=Streptococcus salivarius TaxID=1304 RepID=UPI0034A4BE63
MLKENLCLIKINNNISRDFLEELFLLNILNIIQLLISQEFPTSPEVLKKQFLLLLGTPYSEFISEQKL